MRVLVEKRYVNAETCAISDPVVQEITNCPVLCNDCMVTMANRQYQGSYIASSADSLINGHTGNWVALANLFPGSTTPIPGIEFGTGVPHDVIPTPTYPTACGFTDTSGLGGIIGVNVLGRIRCDNEAFNISLYLSVWIRFPGGIGWNFICALPAIFTTIPVNCVNPFEISFTFNQDDLGDAAFGTGDLTFTFVQTFP